MSRNWFPAVFDDFFDNDTWLLRQHATAPAVNVKENAREYIMEVAAPGIRKEYCRIHIDAQGNLMVSVENKFEHKEEDKKAHYLRREFAYTNFQQTYTLPADVDKEHIAARVSDGVLAITLPKFKKEDEAKVTRQIQIQ